MIIGFTGHRDRVTSTSALKAVMDSHPGSMWVHGGAEGFDEQVNTFALMNDLQVEVVPLGLLANRIMLLVDRSDLIVACYDGRKKGGTYRAISYAIKQGKEIHYVPAFEIKKEDPEEAQAEEDKE